MEKKFIRLPEIWGGIECSYNRVKGKYFDQLVYAGHYRRMESDIALFAELGIRHIRYPVIWERLQPKHDKPIDWSWSEKALDTLRRYQITPIAGLVHHGSGPRYADVTSPAFAPSLQQFARSVAEKFPWITHYTPVNEPLTTARFCSLYGLWYPHKRNDRTFVNVLLNEMKGVVLAMQAVRAVNPEAKLVQTEDLAKIYSTHFMKYQADFENHRRWLTFDILCGNLKPGHPLWNYFKRYAASEADLFFFVDHPCPPDVLGLDYYPTSERYLDERLEKYPPHYHGHNHRHRYADVEALRVRHGHPSGIRLLLNEVWNRYKRPMAISEVHIHCDTHNQIRWFSEIRNVCADLIRWGVDIRAITTWAMLGSFGWNKLLTVPGGDYEPGAFDVRQGHAQQTPLGDYIQQLIRNPDADHPALAAPGWWHEESRFMSEVHQFVPEPIISEECFEP